MIYQIDEVLLYVFNSVEIKYVAFCFDCAYIESDRELHVDLSITSMQISKNVSNYISKAYLGHRRVSNYLQPQ